MILNWIEIFKFLKNNIIKIIMGTMIITLLFVFLSNNQTLTEELENLDQITNQNEVSSITDVPPASFSFSGELENGVAFTNALLIEQYLLSTDVLEEASLETGIDIYSLVNETGNEIPVSYYDSGVSKIIGVTRNTTSYLIELSINLGNKENNLLLTNYYYQYIIEDNRVPFLNDKNITVFKRPAIKEFENNLEELTENIVKEENTLVQNIVIGSVVGLITSTLGLWLYSWYSKKIKYSLSYSIDKNDNFILIDSRNEKNEQVMNLFNLFKSDKTVFINQGGKEISHSLLMNDFFNGNSEINIVDSFSKISNIEEINRIVYIVEEDITRRNWYQDNRVLDQYYNINKYVVQLNK